MTREEIEKSVRTTLARILCTKRKISRCTDEREKRKLERQLKELQYLQLWHHDLYNSLTEDT